MVVVIRIRACVQPYFRRRKEHQVAAITAPTGDHQKLRSAGMEFWGPANRCVDEFENDPLLSLTRWAGVDHLFRLKPRVYLLFVLLI